MTDLDKAYAINKAGFHIIEETSESYHLADYNKTTYIWINKYPDNEFVITLHALQNFMSICAKSGTRINTQNLILKENIKDIDMGSM